MTQNGAEREGLDKEALLEELAATIEAGLALSPQWYTDPAIYRFEQEAIFRRTWQYAGHASKLAEDGDYITTEVGGVPIVVVRDGAEIRAFVNICRHRSYVIAQGEGRRKTLQCHYHAWTYNLDGTLRAAPRCEREAEFDKGLYPLLPAQVELWGPLVFVNPDMSAAPLRETLGKLPEILEERDYDLGAYTLRAVREYPCDCNWKILVDNMVECYHCPTAHPSFAEYYHVEPETYSIEQHEYFCYQRGPLRDFAEAQALKNVWGDFELVYLWPNLLLIIGPLGYVVVPMRPVTTATARLTFEAYFLPEVEQKIVDEYVQYYDEILKEDGDLVAGVQRGHNAGILPRGPLLLDSEDMLQHVQRLIYRALSGEQRVAGAAR